MPLDPHTLLVLNVVNVLVLAMTLPFMMGDRLSPAARAARQALVVQAGGWIALILSGSWSGQWPDVVLSTLAMVCISVANGLMFQALQGWLGPLPGRRVLGLAMVLMPVGYALGFGSYPFRVAWSNLWIATQMLTLAAALVVAPHGRGGRWRWVLLGSMLVMAAVTAARGVMGGWMTELYPHFTAPHPVNVLALVVANVALVLVNVTTLVAWREEAEDALRTQAVTDQLTGVANRHGWHEAARTLVAQAQRHGFPVALILIDLDHFKAINDTHGHEAGDAALRLFGQLLSQGQRAGDLVARLGGEEFGVLLSHADVNAICGFDRRLRERLRVAAVPALRHGLNFSSGGAVLAEGETLDQLSLRADAAVYRAKAQGRGQLQLAAPFEEPSEPS